MDTIKKLEEMKLQAKVMKELEKATQLDMNDKQSKEKLNALSRFIIHIYTESGSKEKFIMNLIENGAEFNESTINALYTMISEVKGTNSKGPTNTVNDINSNPNKGNENDGMMTEEQFVSLCEINQPEGDEEVIHTKLLYDKPKEEIKKQFSSLAIPNRNKEELDIELGVIFEDQPSNNNTTGGRGAKGSIKIRKQSPIRLENKNLQSKRERSPSPPLFNLRLKDKDNNNSHNHSNRNRRDNDDDSETDTEKPYDKHNSKSKIKGSELKQNGIYDGIITKVMEYGCFVLLDIDHNRKLNLTSSSSHDRTIQGFVHKSQIKSIDYTSKPKHHSALSLVKVQDKVKVKVISLENNKISLSMNQVDQETGEDISKAQMMSHSNNTEDNNEQSNLTKHNPSLPKTVFGCTNQIGPLTGIPLDTETKHGKQMHSPEMWELNQMKNGKAFDYVYDPILSLTNNTNEDILYTDENLDIELKEEEPHFLKGQTTKAGINFSPIRLVKNPDGTMHRSAIQQAEQAKNRRELRELQTKTNLDNIPREVIKGYNNQQMNSKDGNYNGNMNQQQQQQIKKFHTTSRSYMSIKEQRQNLPIYLLKAEIMKAIKDNRILVVIGETGSGKTTQITQYLVEAEYAKYGKIGCTQPRRVAAMSVAKRVSEEFGCKLGEYVGYSIRFEDCCSENTLIKYMTDGMLLREALIDKNLTQYSVIMLDEAHERTIHTDILFGLLKDAMRNRNDLKLIVTSATLDSSKFSRFFNNCPVFRIPGRTFDVELFYSKEPEYDYMEAALITVMQIHLTERSGDILLFLTGQEEIDTACQTLQARMNALGKSAPLLSILPVYSALSSELQSKIFDPAPEGTRKCVIATNIAEASLTIDGIYFVVDPGFAKIKAYNPKIGMDSLMVAPISQSSAMQRAGRAGRTGPGKCYRLYTYEAFTNEMLKATIPEIQRTNLANTVLLLKALGINDLINFEFMDPPPLQTLIAAMEQLYYLGALDEEGLLTKLGRRMAEFPLEPQLSKMLLASVDLGCSEELITIVSMLSVQNIFNRPRDKQSEADQKKIKFIHPDGDHLTLLKVFEMWTSKNKTHQWCKDNFIHHRGLKKAEDIKKQLIAIMERYKLSVVSCRRDYAKVRKAITAGFFFHVARKDPREGYRTIVDNQTIYIHPSSALFNKSPEWVVYHELVLTSKEYMREITSIDPKWLVDVAGKFFKKCNPNILSKRQKNEKIEPLFNKYEDTNAWRLSKRRGIIY